MHDITIRMMDFQFPDPIDPICVEGAPEESYGMIAFSLLLPHLEPYLIRTMKEAKKHITDPDLVADLEKFNGQEGQHYRMHRRFNEVVCKDGGFDRLPAFEAELGGDYERFTKTKSLRFNLAYAEGFEALTTATAQFSAEQGFAEGMHPALRNLMQWHLIEEFEHRTVAFDVYGHVCGGYLYRLAVGTYAQWHMARWISRVAAYLLGADDRALSQYGGMAGRKQRSRARGRMMRKHLLGKVLRTYTPWYTPHRIEMSEELRAMGERFSGMAVSTR